MKGVKIENLNMEQIEQRKIKQWPIWEKEVSRFDWLYTGDEECLILEGEIIVESEEGEVMIKSGDFVTFEDGLKCVWDIKKPVRKHYNFK